MRAALAQLDLSALALSLRVALMATVAALAAGVPLAWLLSRRRFVGRAALEALATLPLALPPTVLGYYLLVAVGRGSAVGRAYAAIAGHPLSFTVDGAVLAATVQALPLVVRGGRAAITTVDPAFERAARTLGASEARIAATITLPLARRGIVAAATLAFARALGEFGVTLMVAGNIPGETRTAALAVYDALQAGHDAEAGATSAVLLAVALAAVALMTRLGEGRGA